LGDLMGAFEASESEGETTAGELSPASIRVQRRIEWPDTDASGIAHNTTALRLVETAEMALLERLGFVHQVAGKLPRVHIEVSFHLPLRFRDVVDVSLQIGRVGRSSLTYEFKITADERVAVVGTVVTVLLNAQGKPVAWQENYRRLLQTAGPQRPELLVIG
jgi:YbgC/YbaW family acyl-CoA thioester hydrolase